MNIVNLVQEIKQSFASHANPANAARMKQYMRGKFEFFGINSPQRKELSKPYLSSKFSNQEVREFLKELWSSPERELQYFGIAYLNKHGLQFDKEEFEVNLEFARRLITEKSWWDTVDCLADHLVGDLVRSSPRKGKQAMKLWIKDENLWLRRCAILHQLSYKCNTDSQLLFEFCAFRAHEKEFFIQKAIGWALREFAKTDRAKVSNFLKAHKEGLSRLSYREATKHL
ncbi:predicted protein [Nematostella vectensis]|uniref:DNA alkylation repair protein n=1 Tax=Nematostella vectensis TaxID=45351 RepID=A7RHJ1_NEMVE|nr:predicted protein [Nematostella vectensis]|eukprot:XP_001641053.1 predicted protein [Nematostella vectensis]